MKITVNVEATAQEMREFLGLPNVQPLQEEMMQVVLDSMRKGASGFEAATLFKPMLPPHLQSMDVIQRAFWDSFSKAATGKAGDNEKDPEQPDSAKPKDKA